MIEATAQIVLPFLSSDLPLGYAARLRHVAEGGRRCFIISLSNAFKARLLFLGLALLMAPGQVRNLSSGGRYV